MQTNGRIITIDGPAAAGKSTLAKALAKELNYIHLNTGLLYRAITCLIIHEKVDYNDKTIIDKFLKSIDIQYEQDAITINNINFKNESFSTKISEKLSDISKNREIREKLTEIQRLIAQNKNIVVDGRDSGTVVFPDAYLKIFLSASAENRARRRYNELKEKGITVTIEEIIEDLQTRDFNDRTRKIAPLIKPIGAIEIDNTNLSIKDQIHLIKKSLITNNKKTINENIFNRSSRGG